MSIKLLKYYGYREDVYKNCLELILESNLRQAKILNIWFTILCVVFLIVSRFDYFVVLSGNPLVYISYFILAMLWNITVIIKKDFTNIQIRILYIINILFLSSFSLYTSVMQPYMSGVMYPVTMVIMAVTYIDTFYIMSVAMIVGSITFAATSYYFKPLTLLYVDGFNVVNVLVLALVLHYSFQHMRVSRFVTYIENISIQHSLEVRSSFDALTSLLNRGRFFTMAGEILKNPHEDYIVLCLFDLDGFKQINDQLGHQMGDKAIQLAGEALLTGFGIDFGEKYSFEKRAVKEKLSFAGRLGGDEFVVFLRGRKNREKIKEEALKILEGLEAVQAGALNGLHSSVGIVEIFSKDHDLDEAYARADEALYQSKEAGKHRVTFYDEGEHR